MEPTVFEALKKAKHSVSCRVVTALKKIGLIDFTILFVVLKNEYICVIIIVRVLLIIRCIYS